MSIDFYIDAIEITNKLKLAERPPDCEMIIANKVNKLIQNRKNDKEIIIYLKSLSKWLQNKIAVERLHGECINYTHAACFIDSLLKKRYWKRSLGIIK